MIQYSLYPIADSLYVVAAIVLTLLALLAVRPKGGSLGKLRTAAIVALRFAMIALVTLLMLRPTIVMRETKKQAASLVILADQSRSMGVGDMLGGKTRFDAMRESLDTAAPQLKKLGRDFELKAYGFDAETRPLAIEAGQIALDEAPAGEQTAIGAALDDLMRYEAGKRFLGVILLSDGAQRALPPRDAQPQPSAVRLKYQGGKLFTVPFGQSRGLGQARDVAVKDLIVNSNVFVKNDLEIAAQIRVDGFVNKEIPIRALFETAPGKMEVVAEEKLRATADGQILPVKMVFRPETPGEFKLTLEAVPQTGELVTTNNELSTFVRVIQGGLNVLYIEGTRRPEMKFVRRALDASPDIKVDYLAIDAQRSETRPGDLAERFQPGKYSVYILGDVDSSAFTEEELKQLAATVGQGAGLIMLGGFHSYGPGGWQNTPLKPILPIAMDRLDRQPFDSPPRKDLHISGPLQMQPTQLGKMHFALMLAADRNESAALWAKLPSLDGANLFRGGAPGAVVLADDGKGHPLLVSHTYGDGRVLASAVDSTWRWWLRGFPNIHRRFWRQTVLWLAKQDQLSAGDVWVRLEKRRFAPGERVDFRLGAQAAGGEVEPNAEFEVTIVSPDGQKRALRPVRQGEQTLGSFRETTAPGDYTIEVAASRKGQPIGTTKARFLVYRQDLELDNAAADTAAMEGLALLTGGEAIAPEQLPSLIDRLTRDTESLEVQQETKKTLWDIWPLFLLMVGLLSVEWYLRKRWGLV